MGSFAYKDFTRKEKVYATSCPSVDKSKNFFCWNPDCNAKVNLKAANSIHKNPYFGLVSEKSKHSGWCKSISLEKSSRDYDQTGFDFSNIIMTLLNKPSPPAGRVITTTSPPTVTFSRPISIADLYTICKSIDITEDFGGVNRKEMLCDDKSNFFYTRGVLGHHLVECTYHHYDTPKKTLYFKYPLNPKLKNKHMVGLKCSNTELYDKLRKFIHGCPPDRIFVLAGNWFYESGNFVTECNSKIAVYTL